MSMSCACSAGSGGGALLHVAVRHSGCCPRFSRTSARAAGREARQEAQLHRPRSSHRGHCNLPRGARRRPTARHCVYSHLQQQCTSPTFNFTYTFKTYFYFTFTSTFGCSLETQANSSSLNFDVRVHCRLTRWAAVRRQWRVRRTASPTTACIRAARAAARRRSARASWTTRASRVPSPPSPTASSAAARANYSYSRTDMPLAACRIHCQPASIANPHIVTFNHTSMNTRIKLSVLISTRACRTQTQPNHTILLNYLIIR